MAIVEDDEGFRLVLQEFLDQSRKFNCVGSYANGEEALIGIPQSSAQVVVMDVKLPGMSGMECTRRLKALLPRLIIVIVTGLDDPRTIDLARECGANGFLAKPFTCGRFLDTLSFCVSRPKSQVAQPPTSGESARHRGLRGRPLTPRENRLMERIAAGLPYKTIAEETGVSKSAVHHMTTNIFKKLGVTNKVDAIRKWKNNNRRSH